MRKFLLVLVAIFLMASSAYAWVDTATNGPEDITTCYAKGTSAMTSGNVVILSTTSATRTVEFPGMEVTGTTTAGSAIYGVVVDNNNYSALDMIGGRYIKVQVYGYCPIVKTAGTRAIAIGDGLATSGTLWCADLNGSTGGRVTGSVVAFSAQAANQSSGTVSGFLKGGL